MMFSWRWWWWAARPWPGCCWVTARTPTWRTRVAQPRCMTPPERVSSAPWSSWCGTRPRHKLWTAGDGSLLTWPTTHLWSTFSSPCKKQNKKNPNVTPLGFFPWWCCCVILGNDGWSGTGPWRGRVLHTDSLLWKGTLYLSIYLVLKRRFVTFCVLRSSRSDVSPRLGICHFLYKVIFVKLGQLSFLIALFAIAEFVLHFGFFFSNKNHW